MNKTKKVRCPHCKGINTVNIDEELIEHKEWVIKMRTFEAEIPTPKAMVITCSHCGKSFKIEIA